ncbi:MAG: hypothetical protein Ta2A_15680 [Treponemataceae bacterium]|nr:MAG: hypothetical protein Ta2A_15680 [Treponemataceae bacterium]
MNTYTATITVTYEGSNTGTERSTASVEFVVTSPTTPPPTIAPMLTVTAPTFASLGGGYTPTAGNIIINNTGTAAATGISVTVSPATAFTIGGSGSTVNAGSQITGWTVQPKAALG